MGFWAKAVAERMGGTLEERREEATKSRKEMAELKQQALEDQERREEERQKQEAEVRAANQRLEEIQRLQMERQRKPDRDMEQMKKDQEEKRQRDYAKSVNNVNARCK